MAVLRLRVAECSAGKSGVPSSLQATSMTTFAGRGGDRLANARGAVRDPAVVLGENDDIVARRVGLAAAPVEFPTVKPRLAGGWSETQ